MLYFLLYAIFMLWSLCCADHGKLFLQYYAHSALLCHAVLSAVCLLYAVLPPWGMRAVSGRYCRTVCLEYSRPLAIHCETALAEWLLDSSKTGTTSWTFSYSKLYYLVHPWFIASALTSAIALVISSALHQQLSHACTPSYDREVRMHTTVELMIKFACLSDRSPPPVPLYSKTLL